MTLPVFLPLPAPKDATPWTILSWGSALLYGFSQHLRPQPLGCEHLSWGSNAPTAHWEERVHVPPVARSSSPVLPGIYQQVPPCRLRCRSQVFPTSQRSSSSPHRPAIFRQVALMGFCPSGSCSFHEAPDARRRRYALLTLLRRVGLSPFLGGDTRRRISRLPRMHWPTPLFVYRAFVFVEIGLRH